MRALFESGIGGTEKPLPLNMFIVELGVLDI